MEKWREEGQKELVMFKQAAGQCACLGDPGLAHPRKTCFSLLDIIYYILYVIYYTLYLIYYVLRITYYVLHIMYYVL